MSGPVVINCGPSHETLARLQHQSLRFERAVGALRAVSELAASVQALKGSGFAAVDNLSADNLAGLAATLADGLAAPLRELDEVIEQLEAGGR